MRINFFEEYPDTVGNLEKSRLLTHPATIYLAAESLKAFLNYRTKLLEISPNMIAGYWPVLPRSYWISPFSYTQELECLRADLDDWKDEVFPVMIDLELPFMEPMLFLKNVGSFSRNKRIIRSLVGCERFPILAAEYSLPTWPRSALSTLGITYPHERHHRRIIMYYTSTMPRFWLSSVQKYLEDQAHKPDSRLEVGLGCLATGAFGNEPILTPANLKRDLQFLSDIGVITATLFRLGGLNQQYMETISQFST